MSAKSNGQTFGPVPNSLTGHTHGQNIKKFKPLWLLAVLIWNGWKMIQNSWENLALWICLLIFCAVHYHCNSNARTMISERPQYEHRTKMRLQLVLQSFCVVSFEKSLDGRCRRKFIDLVVGTAWNSNAGLQFTCLYTRTTRTIYFCPCSLSDWYMITERSAPDSRQRLRPDFSIYSWQHIFGSIWVCPPHCRFKNLTSQNVPMFHSHSQLSQKYVSVNLCTLLGQLHKIEAMLLQFAFSEPIILFLTAVSPFLFLLQTLASKYLLSWAYWRFLSRYRSGLHLYRRLAWSTLYLHQTATKRRRPTGFHRRHRILGSPPGASSMGELILLSFCGLQQLDLHKVVMGSTDQVLWMSVSHSPLLQDRYTPVLIKFWYMCMNLLCPRIGFLMH